MEHEYKWNLQEAGPAAPPPRLRRGLACVDPQRRAEISRKGGLRAQALGLAHRWTREEASAAGRKGMMQRWKRAEEEA